MDKSHDIEENNVAALYEASHKGCVSTLNSLMQRDAFILNKTPLTSFTDTPLHIAVLHGHLEFTAALLREKPNLAGWKDSRGRTALHLASSVGHAEIVRELLQADTDVCLSRDQDGRIPLHLAVMRGHIEVVDKLLKSKSNSISEDLDGASVLHLCVKYNCLDALKLLVESADDNGYSLNSKDNDGNSILHLAVMLGQRETIKYLLSVPKIQDMLPTTQRHDHERARYINNEEQPAPAAQSRFKKWWAYFCLCEWVKHFKPRDRSDWIIETRGTLMLVATVIATVTFQTGINPPGGVWQQDCEGHRNFQNCIGKAIFSHISPNEYQLFLSFNTTSLVAALSVVLLVTIGIPKRSKLFIWLLTLAMLIAVTSLLSTYLLAVILVTSDTVKEKPIITWIVITLFGIWSVLLVIAVVVLIYRLLLWMVKSLLKCIRCLTMSPTN